MTFDELPQPPSDIPAPRRREELRRALISYAKKSSCPLVDLFDLWGNVEKVRGTPAWQVAVGHVIRELLEAFYKEQERPLLSFASQIVDSDVSPFDVPQHLRSKFSVNFEQKQLTWTGSMTCGELSELQDLSQSQAYKYCCWLLFSQLNRSPVEEDFANRVGALLEKNDPLGPTPHIRANFISKYKRTRDKFVDACHSKGGSAVPNRDWDKLITEAEDLIFALVGQQVDVIKEIERRLGENAPTVEALRGMKPLVVRNTASFNFFFDVVPSTWLDALIEDGWFANVPKVTREESRIISTLWGPSKFLLRVSEQEPRRVFTVIQKFQFEKDTEPRVIGDVLDCLALIHPKVDVSKTLKRIHTEQWLQHDFAWTLVIHAVSLWKLLLKSSAVQKASLLLEGLLGFCVNPSRKDISLRPFLNDYYLRLVLDDIDGIQNVDDLRSIIHVLGRSLTSVTNVRSRRTDKQQSGLSEIYLWDHEKSIRESLQTTLSRFFEFNDSVESPIKELQRLTVDLSCLKEKTHLQALVMLNNCGMFEDELKALLLGAGLKDSVYEKVLLPRFLSLFGRLEKDDRRRVLDIISNGPEDIANEDYVIYWKRRRLEPIWQNLTDEEKERFAEVTPTEFKYETEPSGGFWHGPVSPLKIEDLEKRTPEEILEVLLSFEPGQTPFEDSIVALAQTFGMAVQQRPGAFAEVAEQFFRKEIDPTYLYHFLAGLRAACKQNEPFCWGSVLHLMTLLTVAAEQDKLECESDRETLAVGWAGVIQAIGELLVAGLDASKMKLDAEQIKEVYAVIRLLCHYPDPDSTKLAEMLEEGTEPGHVAINSARGWGFHALFSLLRFLNRLDKERYHKIIAEGVNCFLNESKHNYVVSYQAGYFLPWLFDVNPAVGKRIIDEVLCSKDLLIARAAWEGYLGNQLWKVVHLEIEPAVTYLLDAVLPYEPPWKDRSDAVSAVAHHLVNAFLFDLTPSAFKTLNELLVRAAPAAGESIISYVGTSYFHREEDKEEGSRPVSSKKLLQLWDMRLADNPSEEELIAFGWWITLDRLPVDAMLDRYIETLKRSAGRTEPLITVRPVLQETFRSYPVSSLTALALISESPQIDLVTFEFREGRLLPLLRLAEQSGDEEQSVLATRIREAVLKLGLTEYSKP